MISRGMSGKTNAVGTVWSIDGIVGANVLFERTGKMLFGNFH